MPCRSLLAFVPLLTVALAAVPAAAEPLAHSVFFELADDTPASRDELIAACEQYLDRHEGCVFFRVGVLASGLDREVNDQAFDVAAHLFFEDREAHDRYQTHPRHLRFIEVVTPLLAGVRVFDADLVAAARSPEDSESP
ncbi:MAG: Dabb family protein [Planctomycetota bacterium]